MFQTDHLSKANCQNIGFISTRLAGTDGVTLETKKWADVFISKGFNCFYLAGEIDTPPDKSMLVEEAHFHHPRIREIHLDCYGRRIRKSSLTSKIHRYRVLLKRRIYQFIKKFDIHVLVPENSLTIPLNIPLGLALTEVIAETGMPAIAHHHDFFWERKRFLNNCIWDYLNAAFPPHLPFIKHVVINSSGANQLALRTGCSSVIIPNVMDFDNPPNPPDEYASDVRQQLGIKPDELFILQPTRVVQRKGIEHAIEIVSRLKMKSKLVISHASGDEGYEYERRVREYAAHMGVNALFVDQVVGETRGTTSDGRKIYTLWDLYPHADLVTYPSSFEGFGNAFLEAIFFKKPIVVNNYSIYSIDIRPKGFRVIELNDFVTESVVRFTRRVLRNRALKEEMVNHNYELARHHYSYSVLEKDLTALIIEFFGL
jgi:glycosyltransferase involved in cell wall biosynthesis